MANPQARQRGGDLLLQSRCAVSSPSSSPQPAAALHFGLTRRLGSARPGPARRTADEQTHSWGAAAVAVAVVVVQSVWCTTRNASLGNPCSSPSPPQAFHTADHPAVTQVQSRLESPSPEGLAGPPERLERSPSFNLSLVSAQERSRQK
ncbi:hypothetical protein FOCC_FOCC003761 [Frankliniella occidentalis]|nr:hypothetical protein FOCC_FOCC003761 [Frankliniella occidentalis]